MQTVVFLCKLDGTSNQTRPRIYSGPQADYPGSFRGRSGRLPFSAAQPATPAAGRHSHLSPEPGWTRVQSRSARRREISRLRERSAAGRHDGHSIPAYSRPKSTARHSWRRGAPGAGRRHGHSAAFLEFKRKTEGRCFICLGPDHRASSCRDPVRCFS